MSEQPQFNEPEKVIRVSWDEACQETRFPDQKIGKNVTYTLKGAKKEYSKYKNRETGEYDLKYKYHFLQNNSNKVDINLYLTLNAPPKFEITEKQKKKLVFLDQSWLFHVFSLSGAALIIQKEFVLPYKTQKGHQYKKGDKEFTILMNQLQSIEHVASDTRTEFQFEV